MIYTELEEKLIKEGKKLYIWAARRLPIMYLLYFVCLVELLLSGYGLYLTFRFNQNVPFELYRIFFLCPLLCLFVAASLPYATYYSGRFSSKKRYGTISCIITKEGMVLPKKMIPWNPKHKVLKTNDGFVIISLIRVVCYIPRKCFSVEEYGQLEAFLEQKFGS